MRRRLYERLGGIIERAEKPPLFLDKEEVEKLSDARQLIHDYPLTETARDHLRRLLKNNENDKSICGAVLSSHALGRLCPAIGEEESEARIICSMGLVK